MTKDNRRQHGVFAAIVADPWRKLLAITLAVASWFLVDSRIRKTTRRNVPLLAVGAQMPRGAAIDRLAVALPTDQVEGLRFMDGEREIKQVSVVISGPRFKVDALEREPWDLQITNFLRLDWTGRTLVEFTAADLPPDQRLLKDLSIEFEPVRIRLDVAHVATREFPLTWEAVDVVESPLQNRLRPDTAKFTPATAVVLGQEAGIEQLARAQVKRFRAVMKVAGNDNLASAPLELIDELGVGLRFATQPRLTVQVLPQTREFDLELPVFVDDLALPADWRGKYAPEASTRTVRIAAGGQLLTQLVSSGEGGDAARAEWAAANLRLLVHIPRPEAGASYLPEMDRPARVLLVGRLSQTVDRNECLLAENVVVKLRQKP